MTLRPAPTSVDQHQTGNSTAEHVLSVLSDQARAELDGLQFGEVHARIVVRAGRIISLSVARERSTRFERVGE